MPSLLRPTALTGMRFGPRVARKLHIRCPQLVPCAVQGVAEDTCCWRCTLIAASSTSASYQFLLVTCESRYVTQQIQLLIKTNFSYGPQACLKKMWLIPMFMAILQRGLNSHLYLWTIFSTIQPLLPLLFIYMYPHTHISICRSRSIPVILNCRPARPHVSGSLLKSFI